VPPSSRGGQVAVGLLCRYGSCVRSLVSLVLTVSLIALASPGRAEVSRPCRELFVESRFSEALACFDTALRRAEGDRELVAEIFAFRAAIHAALRRDERALREMRVVLALEPGWEPRDPTLTSPKVTELLELVRSSFERADGPPELSTRSPRDVEFEGYEHEIEVTARNLTSPLSVVALVRHQGSTQFREVELEHISGDRYVTTVSLEDGDSMEYVLAIRASGGALPVLEGSREAPLTLSRSASAPIPDCDRRCRARRLWWGWAIVGVALIATGVAVGVGLAARGDQATGSVELSFP